MNSGLIIKNINDTVNISEETSIFVLSSWEGIETVQNAPTNSDNSINDIRRVYISGPRASLPGFMITPNIKYFFINYHSVGGSNYFNVTYNNTENAAICMLMLSVIFFKEDSNKSIILRCAEPSNRVNNPESYYSSNYGMKIFDGDRNKVYDSRDKPINKNSIFEYYFLNQEHILNNGSTLIPNKFISLNKHGLYRNSPTSNVWSPIGAQFGINSSHRTGFFYPYEGNPYPLIPQHRGKKGEFYLL